MKKKEVREKVAEKAHEIFEEGLNQRTFGNFSIRTGDGMSAVPYDKIEAEDVLLVDLEGNKIEGAKEPSTETPLHLEVYKRREDFSSLAHTHSPYATVFSCLGEPIPPTHNLLAYLGGEIQVAEYANNGTELLGENAAEALKDKKAVLLRNHGVLTGGEDAEDAHYAASVIEFCAEMHYRARSIGEPEQVDSNKLEELESYFEIQLSDSDD